MSTGAKKKAMTVVYEVDGVMYINLTNRCSNRCDFCIRNNGDGAYGSDSLWLEREPTVDEVCRAIDSFGAEKYPEAVFCGYGEPTYRLEEEREIALYIKSRYPTMKIRINTNGQSDLIHGKNTAPLYKDAFDTVSISLNAPSAEKYQRICHSIYGDSVLEAIKLFAKRVSEFVPSVKLSVVRETLTEQELEECRAIADSVGVALRVRDYIGANPE